MSFSLRKLHNDTLAFQNHGLANRRQLGDKMPYVGLSQIGSGFFTGVTDMGEYANRRRKLCSQFTEIGV